MSASSPYIRLLIADDHPAILEGLRTMINDQSDMRVVAAVRNGVQAVQAVLANEIDVILMDLQMPTMDGLAAIAAIHKERPASAIIVLTTYPGDGRVCRAMRAGALSYLLKTSSIAEILAAVRSAAVGRSVLANEVACQLAAPPERLSEREVSVLKLVSEGNQNRSIGQLLKVSEETIKTRIKNILAKLQARDRTHAVTIARMRGFIDG